MAAKANRPESRNFGKENFMIEGNPKVVIEHAVGSAVRLRHHLREHVQIDK